MSELFFIALIGITCVSIGLKYCMYKCGVENGNEIVNNANLIIVDNEIQNDDEVPPKYEDI